MRHHHELHRYGHPQYHTPEWPRGDRHSQRFDRHADRQHQHRQRFSGFAIGNRSTATLTGNTSTNNGFQGVSVQVGSTATLTSNTLANNGANGIFVGTNPNLPLGINTIVATHNTVHRNGGAGIDLARGATATINGGSITLNREQGIRLREGATAAIGLDGAAEVVVSENLGAGIFVTTDGSLAQINRGDCGSMPIAPGRFLAR